MPTTELDSLINQTFAGVVVRKDLVSLVRNNATLPTYVLEYLLGQYAATDDDATIKTGIESVKRILAEHYVARGEAEKIKWAIRDNGSYRIIDQVQASLNEKTNVYEATFTNLGISGVIVPDAIINQHPKLLVAGVWCLADVEYQFTENSKAVPWVLGSLKPIQLSRFDLSEYIAGREKFTTDQWIDLLMQSIGFNPEKLSRRAKFHQLARLIPFVERNFNLIELGPKGTGKSHTYQELSPHAMLVSGGEVTVPKLFVNNSTGRIGLVGFWDVVAFDEFAGSQKRVDKSLVDIMKNYLANKKFSRGKDMIDAEASMAFVGNTAHTVPYMLKNSDLFDALPGVYHDSAFLDRLWHYIPGWEVEVIRGEMFATGFGFVVDFLAEILRELRKFDYSDRYLKYFSLDETISTRDKDGVNKTFSGLMKLVHPSGSASMEEIEELLRFAIEGRKRVKDQIIRIDPTMPAVNFAYYLSDGTKFQVTTAEEDQYPQFYHLGSTGGGSSNISNEVNQNLISAPTPSDKPETIEPTLTGGRITFAEGQRGFTFGEYVVPYLMNASEIEIVDPYISALHQMRNLIELLEAIAQGKSPADELQIRLVTLESRESENHKRSQLEMLNQIQQSANYIGIVFTWEFAAPGTIHDRSITSNAGWIIDLGRGLDVYQPVSNNILDLSGKNPRRRPTKAFSISTHKSQ